MAGGPTHKAARPRQHHDRGCIVPRDQKPTPNAPTPQPARRKRAPLKLSPKVAHETAKKAQALKRMGLYNPTREIKIRTKFTPRQERDIFKRFAKIQAHGIFDSKSGQTIRPFKRTKRGYKLTDAFRTDKRKIKADGYDIIRTRKGSIVPKKLGSIKILKDGTVVTKQKLLGKTRTVHSGTLTPKQTIKFVNDVLEGRFKFPKDSFIRMRLYDSFADDAGNINDLKKWVAKYQTVLIKNGAEKEREPLTLDYVKL